ncbi:MAG: thioredoxin family protein [Cyanosarcina radialis HA8281-LM2]|jgi:thioredoxin 1|nr:thioredoxin family protein [Cyanosarcina radialis HA8281-LM2]
MILSVNEQTFRSEVLESSTPVIVHFSAPWCGLCRLIEPLLKRFQAEWTKEIKLVVINADENFKLANTYRLTTLPTLILFDRGKAIHRLEGFQGRDDLLRALEKSVADFGLVSASTARK